MPEARRRKIHLSVASPTLGNAMRRQARAAPTSFQMPGTISAASASLIASPIR